MSNKYDKMDEIIDRLIKGGVGSGKRGHKSADYSGISGGAFGGGPAADTGREMDPEKKKKILSSDKRKVKRSVKDHSPEELQSKIDSHKELSESEHLSPASRESYATKHKALLAVQKVKSAAHPPAEPKKEEGIASRPGPFGNINKGGPGSGKKGSGKIEPKHFEPNPNLRDKDKDLDRISPEEGKKRRAEAKRLLEERVAARKNTKMEKGGAGSGKKGHTTQKDLESLKGNMGRHHIMQYGDKGSAFSESHRQGKSEVFHHEPTNSFHVVTEGGGVNELKDHPNFKRLGAPHKKDPAAEVRTPTSHGTKPEGKGQYGVEGGKFVSPSSEAASASMKKSLETLFYMKQLAEEGRLKPKQKRNMRKSEIEKVLPIAAKTAFRVVQNLVKPATGGDGSEADNPIGGHDGASVAQGGGTGKQEKGPGKKMKKSLLELLLEKGGIGSGRRGHNPIGRDFSDEAHESVFEDNQFDNVGEREAFKDKMIAAANREEEKATQRIKEQESTAERGISRKEHKAPQKKSLLHRISQKIIDII